MKNILRPSRVLLLIGSLLLVFTLILNSKLPAIQFDLTEQKTYSISQNTKNILNALNKPLELFFFYSSNHVKTPGTTDEYAKRVKALLKTYEHEASGKLTLHIIDPMPFSDEEDKADLLGLQSMPLPDQGTHFYFGLAASDANRETHAISFFTPEREVFLEYEINRLIQGAAQVKRPMTGLISSLPMNRRFDERTQQTLPAWMWLQEVREQFDLTTLSPDVDQIPEELGSLILVHPKQLPEQTLKAIDGFVQNGGKLLVFLDPISELELKQEAVNPTGRETSSALPKLLKAWGVQMLPERVLGDGLYAMSAVLKPGQQSISHPFFIKLPKDSMNQADASTLNVESINLSTAGILEPIQGASTTFTPLLQSSTKAMPFDLARLNEKSRLSELMSEITTSDKRYVLAARIEGLADSAFAQQEAGSETEPKERARIQVVVVADTDILDNRMWVKEGNESDSQAPQVWSDNAAFVVNILSDFHAQSALLNPRSQPRIQPTFTRIEKLIEENEERFREKTEKLETLLAQTDAELTALYALSPPTETEEWTPNDTTTQADHQESQQIRKSLRDLQLQLNNEIASLGRTIKLINIFTIPLLLLLIAIYVKRRHPR